MPAVVLAATPQERAAEHELLSRPEMIGEMLEQGKLYPEEIPNPHWRQDACIACHVDAQAGDNARLRDEDYNRLCNNCHTADYVNSYIHAVGMQPPEDFMRRMPEGFRQAIERGGNKVTCIACHEMQLQCYVSRFDAGWLNPRFFRGGPYDERTELCFNCHDPKKYERYNPHDQITDEGELDTQRCYVCHSVTPDRKAAKSIADVRFNVLEKLEQLCTGCHPWRNHPGGKWASFGKSAKGNGPNHLTVPPEKIRKRLEAHQKKYDISMPLEPDTGRIFCATCHNPHERGVQYQRQADKGADGVKRLRRGRYEICSACHDK